MLSLYICDRLCEKSGLFKSAEGSLRIIVATLCKFCIEMTLVYYELLLYLILLVMIVISTDENFYNNMYNKLSSINPDTFVITMFDENEILNIFWLIMLTGTVLTMSRVYVVSRCIMTLYNKEIKFIKWF